MSIAVTYYSTVCILIVSFLIVIVKIILAKTFNEISAESSPI